MQSVTHNVTGYKTPNVRDHGGAQSARRLLVEPLERRMQSLQAA